MNSKKVDNIEYVNVQYGDKINLVKRISMHSKYSTNKGMLIGYFQTIVFEILTSLNFICKIGAPYLTSNKKYTAVAVRS